MKYGLGWVYLLPPEGITYELTYGHPDSNEPPFLVGVKLDIPITSFVPLSGNFAFKATATNYVERDLTSKLRYVIYACADTGRHRPKQ